MIVKNKHGEIYHYNSDKKIHRIGLWAFKKRNVTTIFIKNNKWHKVNGLAYFTKVKVTTNKIYCLLDKRVKINIGRLVI